MTVANNYAPVVVAANGVATAYSGPWNAISAAYLVVQLLNTTTGLYTTIGQGLASNQYQVTSLTSSGFGISFNTAPLAGNNVVISRLTTPVQTIPYTTSRGFQGSVEETSFDAITNMLQEQVSQLAKSIQVSVGDAAANLVLPIVSKRAGLYLAFDASGNVIATTSTVGPQGPPGNFTGPGVAVSGNLVSFNGTTGGLGQDSGVAAANVPLLNAANTFTKAQRGVITTVAYAATLNYDFSLTNFATLLTGNLTLGIPTNLAPAQEGSIRLRQDSTGSRTLALAWGWAPSGATAPTLSTGAGVADDLYYSVKVAQSAVVTITLATPGVVTYNSHGLQTGQQIQLTTTGTLPTGLSPNTTYYVINTGTNTFNLATSLANAVAGTAIATSVSQSGVHTCAAISIGISLQATVA